MSADKGEPIVPVWALRRYLRTQGWRETPLHNERTDLFRYPETNDIELFVPLNGEVPGAKLAVDAALDTLADLSAIGIAEVIARMKTIGFDLMLAALPNQLVQWNSINLDVAEGFIRHASRLYAFSATSELNIQPVSSQISVDGDQYVSKCRFGHTFRGSFGFSIESPVGGHEEYYLDEHRSPPPVERRYMLRIARGLKIVQSAGETSDPSLIESGYQTGFNANMCDEVVRLFDATAAENIEFEIRFSPEWKLPEDISLVNKIQLNPRSVAVAKEAAAHFRKTEMILDQTIFGFVVLLGTRENPADLEHTTGSRDIAVEWLSDLGGIRVRVRVDPKVYQEAYRAHGEHKQVSIAGNLQQRRSQWVLNNPHDFRVLG